MKKSMMIVFGMVLGTSLSLALQESAAVSRGEVRAKLAQHHKAKENLKAHVHQLTALEAKLKADEKARAVKLEALKASEDKVQKELADLNKKLSEKKATQKSPKKA